MYRRSGGFGRRMMAGAGVMLIAAAPVLLAAHMFKVDDSAVFELDGNPQDETGEGSATGDDWATYFPAPGGGGGNGLSPVFVVDPPNATIFTGGGSKDGLGIANWRHKSGSVPDKDEIQNAYAVAYSVGGDLLIYFGADRTANNGDANIGFWFLQSNVGPNPDGTFSGGHTDGDIFVVSGFTSGGQTSEIDVYKWVGDDATGSLQLITSAQNEECQSPLASPGTKDSCAIANKGDVLSPWPYTPKSGSAGTFPVASFFEGGINVTTLLGGEAPCFSTFFVETRSSTAVTAVLKDFTRGTFTLCAVDITKVCQNGRLNSGGTGFLYDVKGTVTNVGVGGLFDATVTDTFPAGSTPATQTFDVGDLTSGQSKCWPNPADCNAAFTFDSGTSNGPTNNASVAAAASSGGAKTVTDSANPALCPTVPTNPALTVTKVCTTDLTVVNNTVAVQVSFQGQVCNGGDVPVNTVSVTNDKAGSTPASFNLGTLSVGQCKPYGPGTYLPNLATAATPGRYSFADQVTATGTPAFGDCNGGSPGVDCQQTATATCLLCDAGQCPTP